MSSKDGVWEGESVAGTNWVDLKQGSEGRITLSLRGVETSLTPEAALVLGQKLRRLAHDMIKRREQAAS